MERLSRILSLLSPGRSDQEQVLPKKEPFTGVVIGDFELSEVLVEGDFLGPKADLAWKFLRFVIVDWEMKNAKMIRGELNESLGLEPHEVVRAGNVDSVAISIDGFLDNAADAMVYLHVKQGDLISVGEGNPDGFAKAKRHVSELVRSFGVVIDSTIVAERIERYNSSKKSSKKGRKK